MSDDRGASRRRIGLLHYLTVSQRAGIVNFCCEGQPLATIRSYGFPVRCPICQQAYPLRDQQARRLGTGSDAKEKSE